MVVATLLLISSVAIPAQTMKETVGATLRVRHVTSDIAISDLGNAAWQHSEEITVSNYWSGEMAPDGRHFTARLLWSDTAIYVRFDANQTEPLVVSDKPDIRSKTDGLWDRDVCEIFLAPDKSVRNKYFEFEIAPTGEWLDVGIEVTPKKRISDWSYRSHMESAARIENGRVVMAIKIPWSAFGKTPKAGDIWLGNLFRCVGKDPTRGYLAWKATKTKKPAFHVPAKFGEFVFVK